MQFNVLNVFLLSEKSLKCTVMNIFHQCTAKQLCTLHVEKYEIYINASIGVEEILRRS